MKFIRPRSISSVLKSTNNYLIISISLFVIALSLAGAFILYQSHKTVCELFNSKMETSGVSISRELALGEKAIAIHLFNNAISSIKNVGSDVDLELYEVPSKDKLQSCRPGIFTSNIDHNLLFSGESVGIIKGDVRSFKFKTILFFVLTTLGVLCLILKFIKNKLVENIRDQIVSPIELLCTQELTHPENLPLEVQNIAKKLRSLTESIALSEKAKLELLHAKKLSTIATQVAHDVRSPLEVLKSLKSELQLLPEESRRRVQLSVNRIEEIAFNLLKDHKKTSGIKEELKSEELLSLITSVVTEKKIEFRNASQLEINDHFDKNSYGLFSKVQRSLLKSIISNLINNSVESLNNKSGLIEVKLFSENGHNVIQITDNGSGIPSEIKDKLFTKGFTTKSSGNGIGLYNAKQDIEAMKGSICFETVTGKGTSFTISLPKSEMPQTFVTSIEAYRYEKIIILDDDPAFHEVWSNRLKGIKCEIEHIHSVKEMLSKYETLCSKTLLLSDFELMDKQHDGIDTILKLNHASNSVLVTARNEEQAIIERCHKANIKLLPKSLVNNVQVELTSESESEIVLIDDDRLVHLNWAGSCKKKQLSFRGFKSVDDFLAVSSLIDSKARIYIDSNLGDGIFGEIESEKIFNQGFSNLYIATGYEKDSIEKPYWIKEICSKSPESII